MEYRVDREALDEFIARQFELVESLSIPKLLADVVEFRLRRESVSREEVHALWLDAGLATHVCLASFEEPERSSSPMSRPAGRLTKDGKQTVQTIEQPAYLIRSYSGLEERQRSQDAFYGSDEWRQGRREAIVFRIDSDISVVLPASSAKL